MDRYTLTITDSTNASWDLHFSSVAYYENMSLQLTSVCVDKEMYKPGCVKAEVKLTKDGGVTEDDCASVIEYLLNKTVSVCGSSSGGSGVNWVAYQYIIFNVQPRRVYNGGLQTILQLTLYSPDKFMDLRKYSKCYTAKCLGTGVLEDIWKEIRETDKADIYLNYEHQQNMQVECKEELKSYSVIESDGQNMKTTNYLEGMLPYMVQYNESEHSFVSRIANRCGEFFFYENGILTLGLDTKNSEALKQTPAAEYSNKINVIKSAAVGTNVIKIEDADIADVTYNEFSTRDEYDAKCPDYTTKYEDASLRYVQQKSDGKYPHVQTYEGPSVEDIAGYKDQYTEKSVVESYEKSKAWLQMIFFLLQKDNILDMANYIGVNVAVTSLVQLAIQKANSNDYKTNFVDEYDKAENAVHRGSGKIYQFCTAADLNIRLSNEFYQNNKECAEVARKRTVSVKLRETSTKVVKLGDFVNIFGCEYVVTKVHYEAQKDTVCKDKDNWFEAVPALMVKVGDAKYKARYAPAPVDGGTKRTAAPQRAIVKDTSDPLSLGRVRILYPWQPDDISQASPFIRVAQPYASESSGIRFTPQVGDEIMVGYEFDDIERPFMMGAIPSIPTNGAKVDGNDNIISSPNGHQIKFTNPSNATGFIEGFAPALRSLDKFGLSTLWDDDNFSPKLGGSMQLTDSNNIYNIELSTDYRRIRIQSHLGNIEMSALTGITINCPTGDVTIKGKNVNIEAGNKVSITSGKNIGTQRMYSQSQENHSGGGTALSVLHSELSDFVSNMVSDIRVKDILHLNFVDLTAIRTILDGFVKPINGTLLIKSNRFMQLEAGKGKTSLPNVYRKSDPTKGYSASILYTQKQTAKEEKTRKEKELSEYLKKVDAWYLDYCQSLFASLNIKSTCRDYVDSIGIFNLTSEQIVNKMSEIAENCQSQDSAFSAFGDFLDTLTLTSGGQRVEFPLERKEEILIQANSYYSRYYIFRNLNNPDINNRVPAEYLNNLKTIHNQLRTKYKDSFADRNERIKMYREFFYDVIKALEQEKKVVIDNTPKNVSDWLLKDKKIDWNDPGKEAACSDIDKWKCFINSIVVSTGNNQTWDSMKEYFNVFKIADVGDSLLETSALWHPTQDGSILIADSNTNNKTITIDKDAQNDTAIFKYSGGGNVMEEIKKTLTSSNRPI